MSGLFENLAATDDSAYIAHRQATAVANKRVKDRFGAFLANAAGNGDFAARLALVEDDIAEVVRDVVAEYGGDVDKIASAIRQSMMPGMPGAMPGMPGAPGGAPGGMPGMPGAGMAGGQCPQCGGVGCPACQAGGPAGGAAGAAVGAQAGAQNGAYGLTHSIPQAASTGPVQASHEAKGGFCDDCHAWKSGPKAGCTCGEDAPDESSEEEHSEHEARTALHPNQLSIDTQPIMHAQPLPDEPGQEGVSDIDGELAKAPSAVGYGTMGSTQHKEAEALETVKLPKGNADAQGGPSPKIDKGNSGDQFGWSLEPIDTQMTGTPHPSIEQDPTAKAEYNKDDFLAQTDAVTESVELDSAPNLMDDAGFAPGGEEHGPHTDTWSGTAGQAMPVTRESLSAVDPDKNPIRELMDEYSGYLMPNQVEAALRDWEVR